ncbi:MAG: nucleoside triphosphate pyrophosphatase [Syntrophobacteraceae bacterium]|jgi:septum formation protein
MFKTIKPLVLASGSPRRKHLLLSLGIEFLVAPSTIDESAESCRAGKSPAQTAEAWACLKAGSISAVHPDSWILGADTIVVLDGRIFGKPSERPEAVEMLQALSGRAHEVITGMCLLRPGGKVCGSCSVATRVYFKDLSIGEIEAYVRTGEPMDKAGAYGIQGIGAFLARSVEGSCTNVVGLPLCEALEWLIAENIIEPA